MGISTNCCSTISPPPPVSSPSSVHRKTSQATWSKKQRSWRNQCAMGLACLVIGLEMDNTISRGNGIAIAEKMHPIAELNEKGNRWSDKRACPPWQLNSLETIVPEDLPRPAARRRWEGVGFTRIAPAVKVVGVRTGHGSCFTM